MSAADKVVVNSEFTRGVFGRSFPALVEGKKGDLVEVIYPCVDTRTSEMGVGRIAERIWQGKKVLLSINRFERKKGVELALKAFAGLDEKVRGSCTLVVAGMNFLLLSVYQVLMLIEMQAATIPSRTKMQRIIPPCRHSPTL